jgi:hypothetical protein
LEVYKLTKLLETVLSMDLLALISGGPGTNYIDQKRFGSNYVHFITPQLLRCKKFTNLAVQLLFMNNTKEPIFLDIGNKNAQILVLGHSMRGY